MMKASATEHYSGTATIEEIEQYLRVKGDKRRELFAYWGLSSNRSMSWSELWSSMGLEPTQHKKLWGDLQIPLRDNKEVSQITGISVGAINALCNEDNYPERFPPPIRLGPRKKLWISLEILAFEQPSLYLVRAKEIRRLPRLSVFAKPPPMALKNDLNPLPSTPLTEKAFSPLGGQDRGFHDDFDLALAEKPFPPRKLTHRISEFLNKISSTRYISAMRRMSAIAGCGKTLPYLLWTSTGLLVAQVTLVGACSRRNSFR